MKIIHSYIVVQPRVHIITKDEVS